MPYSITHNHPDCPKESGEMGKDQIGGHAVVKDSDNSLIGCHKTHESAEEHLLALNIAMSEEKSLNDSIETRAVDLSAPAFMKKNMKRGLDNLNKAGSGLTSKTTRDARNIINTGKVSPAKARLMFPWHARHLSDLKREKSNPNDPDTWRGSDVAFLLWGSNPWTNPTQAGDWAKRKVDQLNKEDRNYDIKVKAMSQTTKILNKQSRINTVNKETENRSFTLANVEIREKNDGELTYNFSGYASVFDKPYGVRDSKGAYTETIKPGAFKKTLQEQDDVRFLVNHDGIPLARSSSGTLRLEEDDYGLYVEAELDPNNPTVAEVASAMKRGDLDQMSFAFAAVRDDFNGEVRDVQEVRLFDVSVVTYPANSWAGANLRGVDLGEYQKELVEARSGDRAIEVLEQIINKLEKESELDIRSESNPDIEILKIKMKRNGLLKDVTPED